MFIWCYALLHPIYVVLCIVAPHISMFIWCYALLHPIYQCYTILCSVTPYFEAEVAMLCSVTPHIPVLHCVMQCFTLFCSRTTLLHQWYVVLCSVTPDISHSSRYNTSCTTMSRAGNSNSFIGGREICLTLYPTPKGGQIKKGHMVWWPQDHIWKDPPLGWSGWGT